METVCPIDKKCASQVSALLQPLPPPQLEGYFDELIAKRGCFGVKIKQDGQFGKGAYAERGFREEELVLKDQILVGAQHISNKIDCLVCSFCFRFIGSIELQIGRRLYLQSLGISVSNGCHEGMVSHKRKSCSDIASSEEEDDNLPEEHTSSSSKSKRHLPEGFAQLLMNGELKLPHSNQFPLPPAIPCLGGCGEAYYCSHGPKTAEESFRCLEKSLKLCADDDWEASHSLLCTGESSRSLSRQALKEFIQHANDTNDIFMLAAKTLAFTVLRYWKLKASYLKEHSNFSSADSFSLLLEAWRPMSTGHKKRWWDCISLPDDIDSSDEVAFRTDVRDLAFTSLQLLKSAIFDEECEPVFSLEIYGNVIGMFELNNLDLVVASPVEDYFLYIDDLPPNEKEKAEKLTQPILDALGEDYSICCEGTAFYPLQSCMNHSCSPNAKAFKREEDRDGQATIIALEPIVKGQEVTISYIDEELPLEERQALLADYGFECSCAKCLQQM